MKRTKWFRMDQKPARVGVYEVLPEGYPKGAVSRWTWDGSQWMWSKHGRAILFSGDRWRGLTEPAN